MIYAMTGDVEFDCVDCGRHIIALGFVPQTTRCNSCLWIARNVSPEFQAEARRQLGVEKK